MQPAAILSIMVKTQGVDSAQRDLKNLDSSVSKSSGKMSGMLAGAGKIAGGAIVGVGLAAAAAAPKIISLASDAQETASKFKTVFGKEAADATKQLDAFSRATGTSKFALREQAAQLQALVRPMGLNTKNAADMSVGLTKLATDLASFNNSSVDEAITALQSGLVGEAEPLRRFGVQLSAARIEAFAYANGIAKQGEELTAAQKAQASYGIILKDTTLAQGDATRTADSFANQWKRLKSQVTDLATELGVRLLPVATQVVGWMTDFIGKLGEGSSKAGGFRDTVVAVWAAVQKGVGAAVDFLAGVLRSHKDDIENVEGAARNIATAMKWVWEEVVLPVVKRVLPAIQQIVKGAFDVIGGLVKTLSSLLTGDFRGAWEGVKQIFKGALNAIIGQLRVFTAPIREAASRTWEVFSETFSTAVDTVKNLFNDGLLGWLRSRVDDVKSVVEKLAAPFISAFGRMKSSVDALLTVAGKIVGAIKSVVEWIGKIKVPKIDIPLIGGGHKPGTEMPAAAPRSAGGRLQLPASFASTHQTGGLAGYPAVDIFGPPGQAVLAPAAGVITRLSGSAGGPGAGGAFGYSMYLRTAAGEYFLTHFGSRSVRAGQQVSRGQLLGTIADYPDRPDHIHMGLRRYAKGTQGAARGWAWVGEKGPELVNFKGGEAVLSHLDSMRLAGYAGGTAMKGTGAIIKGPDYSKMSPLERHIYKKAAEEFGKAMRAPKPSIKGQLPGAAAAAPAVVESAEVVADSNQALTDAINELARLEQERIDLTNVQLQEARQAFNVSQSQYGVLAQAITDVVSVRMGSTLGIGLSGLRAPAGSVARA